MNFLRPITPATTGPKLMPIRKASLRPPKVRSATASRISRANWTNTLAWSGRDHVAIADRLDLLQRVLLDQAVEAQEHLVEELDQGERHHRRNHRREADD